MSKQLRVAFFADSYLEVNGVAMTSQRLIGFAKKKGYPFLCIYAGKTTESTHDGSINYLSLKRSRTSITLDEDLAYDPFFQRHTNRVLRAILEFRPHVIHITGLNDVSIMGSYLSWKLNIPMLGSWHTNIHEFAAHRLRKILRFLPGPVVTQIADFAQRQILAGSVLYYKMPKVVLSPNQELVGLLGQGTGRVSRIMSRGVDTEMFSPKKRTVDDGIFRLGFVGRLRAEKNVRMLVELEKELVRAGRNDFKFLIVGEGNERGFLEKHLINAEFKGFLEGEQLSEAYANMDVFVFPSKTDTFGNVTQEAFASGVPAIVTDQGGPKFIVTDNETGFVAKDLRDFVRYTLELMNDPAKLSKMKEIARSHAMSRSWDAVFEGVYDAYETAYEMKRIKPNYR
ncbi:MAG: glycosyltransferase [Pyrinomonadaceae bacterium]|nr:glycosyltransferase [Blastocatellia bacterium]MDQ3219662.1 glycosyltransferase [Acidobacteriota bacterium]MDQ3489782.1 glycosyltransferase [Acidobacteriota bacterium]